MEIQRWVGGGERKIELVGEERELSIDASYWEESEMRARKQEKR